MFLNELIKPQHKSSASELESNCFSLNFHKTKYSYLENESPASIINIIIMTHLLLKPIIATDLQYNTKEFVDRINRISISFNVCTSKHVGPIVN